MEVVGTAPARARTSGSAKSRSDAELEHHYRVEIELAGRLRSAPRAERLGLYGAVYDELYRRVPSHPQLTRKVSDAERRAGVVKRIALLNPFIHPDTVFLEIGAGDGSLPDRSGEARAPVLRTGCVARNPERRAASARRDGPVRWLFGAGARGDRDARVQLPGHGTHSSRRCARAAAQPVRRAGSPAVRISA